MPTLAAVNLAFNSLYNCMTYWFQEPALEMRFQRISATSKAKQCFEIFPAGAGLLDGCPPRQVSAKWVLLQRGRLHSNSAADTCVAAVHQPNTGKAHCRIFAVGRSGGFWQIFVRGSVVLADMGACCWELLLPPDRWLRPRISRCFGEGPGTSDEVCDVITCAHPHASRQTSRVRQRSSCSADVSFLRRSCAATLAHSRRRSFEEQCDTGSP